MKLEDVRNISIVGAGIMGHGIAQVFAMGGYDVCLNDVSPELLDRALVRVRENLRIFEENGFITGPEAEAALGRIRTEPDLARCVQDADIVTEAVKEDVEVKRVVFHEITKEAITRAAFSAWVMSKPAKVTSSRFTLSMI